MIYIYSSSHNLTNVIIKIHNMLINKEQIFLFFNKAKHIYMYIKKIIVYIIIYI
jgi:hypothetical protein